MPDLYQRSIEIILANQHASGAYVACPNFPTYRYCWFRDGSFVAYAMDLAGQHQSAERFHAWAARAVNARADVIRRGLAKAARGEALVEADILHTRLTLDGQDGTQEEWTNFQLDGFGTWLWALAEHQKMCPGALPAEWLAAAGLVAGYLAALWRRPCYDCWEEFGDKVHPHSLAAIYAGLKAYREIAGASLPVAVEEAPAAIRAFIEANFVFEGHFVKFAGQPAVDASLLGLAVPYGVVPADDPRMQATVAEIERTLLNEGVHRYPSDTYYGGGEWILLTAWLGWYYRRLGALAGQNADGAGQKIARILEWIASKAAADGSLPEQAPEHLNDPAYYQPWLKRWGIIASPLLWSHANYIILSHCLMDSPA